MSRRSGQSGSVYRKGSKYIGRYRADVPGQNKRIRRTVIIGNISQITKPQAERWLAKFVEGQGINDARYLARSQSPVLTFGLAARGWIDRHLIVNKKRSSQRSMSCELNKHVLPHLKDTPLEEVTYPLVRGLIQMWQRAALSRKSIRNLFGIVRAIYNFQLDEMAQSGKPRPVAAARQMEEGRAPKNRATTAAALHGRADGAHREPRENSDVSITFRFGGWYRSTGRRAVRLEG
ncbi:MAG: hypothetical protein WA197_15210 [Candidatus Acidiferrales bacterium]